MTIKEDQVMDEDMKSRGQWFAVQTLSGQEKKARENI